MTIRTDRRRITSEPSPDLHRTVRAAWRAALEHELRFAEMFAGVLESREYAEQGASTLVEYARRLGYHGARAIVQARLGQAIRVRPELAESLRSRAISIESAEAIAGVVADPATRDVEDWLQLAAQAEPAALRTIVKLRREEAKRQTKEGLELLGLLVTHEERKKTERARQIASQRAGRQLTESEGVMVAVDEYLERRDPERQAARRHGPKGVPAPAPASSGRKRRVPKAVEWKVRERAAHQCEVPGCTIRAGLELCHRRSWSRGGAHHPDNLVLLCHRHHVLLDAGRIACLGFADCGRPIFRMPDGELLLPKPTGPPA